MKQSLLIKMRAMSEAEQYAKLYTDHLTGLYTRAALEDDARPFVAITDLDSLKWVNTNQGYDVGDQYVVRMATRLLAQFGEDSVYRLGGDEIAIKSDSATRLNAELLSLSVRFPDFSYGVGSNLVLADERLVLCKARREREGVRAPTGGAPVWLPNFSYKKAI